MKILLVIHGYPRRYNAGSEIYTQTLAHALLESGFQVSIFTREEDPFLPDYNLRTECDPLTPKIPVYLINHARSNARFQNDQVDAVFSNLIDSLKPDIVHFGHLGHLSMGLPLIAKKNQIPTVFTIHDFWMMCPRGQFLEWGLTEKEPWALCDGQVDAKCASNCFNRFVTGTDEEMEIPYWEAWVSKRMEASRKASDAIDLFLAPSRRLMNRHIQEYGILEHKIQYLDYGFDLERLKNREREEEETFVFGYIGRHHPSKGIHHLIDAFEELDGLATLRIWGRPQGQLTDSLQRRIGELNQMPPRIQWLPEYQNEHIVENVFNKCDCIVVPSIWDENSPLVIHEAQQCGVPVITADHGGMGEYVQDEINGFTFEHRNVQSLKEAMQKAIHKPLHIAKLGQNGYLYSADGQIPSKMDHVNEIIENYHRLIEESGS